MEIKKALSFRAKTERVSSIRKKLAVLFIFGCMAVNGFVPSTAEVSKYSLVMLAASTAQNMLVSLFQKYNAPLEVVASKVCTELREFLFGIPAEEATNRRDAGKAADNTADNHTTVIEQVTINESRQMSVELKENLYTTFVYVEKLFRLYQNIKIPDELAKTILIVAIVMFIIGIRQRRTESEGEAEISSLMNITKKTRISA